ncbi:MAG: bifunctional 23S rRNA (guanine(2069)-N(7))-methyltransferase RlmK/23S rRNA (guanine(2445)-N(2))-methyltransferase RlmL [Spirochaetales bacterium]|nr:bifunctional 23S rRNA (guanine(2069)-N(7))-methyltransferase RlmK/23S rRNA (guanine(2445)-N(2))-methyltransferase RlmL [Spirochaetales bacterium]
MHNADFFCTCPRNAGDLLVTEARDSGATGIREHTNGVEFAGALETGYKLCLWSRIASKVLLKIGGFHLSSADDLYEGARSIDWDAHMDVRSTFAVHVTVTKDSPVSKNFAVLRIKDAIADSFRERTAGARPSVDTETPELTFAAHINRNEALLYLDLSGPSLHRRGYRREAGPAPLKENVAAAMLLRAGWKEIAQSGGALVDPMCGSGTIPIEGALIAGDIAPGLSRDAFGFESWKQHDKALWLSLIREAEERRAAGIGRIPRITGYDKDRRAVTQAVAAAGLLGLSGVAHFEKRELSAALPPGKQTGLVAVNPPYGVRLHETESLLPLYRNLGSTLRNSFPGWKAVLLTGDQELSMATALRASKTNTLYNGDIPCVLAQFDIYAGDTSPTASGGGKELYLEQFGNRLEKNYRRLSKWAEKEKVSCYRVYDADMPEFSAAIDLYESTWVHVQEYAPPPTVDPKRARARLQVILEVIPQVLGVRRENVHVKTRERQESGGQYEHIGNAGVFNEIHEGGLSFLANFTDYLDTGIFLDHRITRDLIRKLAGGRTFLNLFSYTGSATVYAVDGGAKSSVSVDNSNTYTSWAEDNLRLNGMFHETLIRDEAREYLVREKERFDLIFIDPPTFSRSKRFRDTFQIQRDHVELINLALKRLTPSGIIFFSTNYRKFKLDYDSLRNLQIEDLTEQTIPEDFRRNRKIHQLWRLSTERP